MSGDTDKRIHYLDKKFPVTSQLLDKWKWAGYVKTELLHSYRYIYPDIAGLIQKVSSFRHR
jgi:hypothetical protein